jgi:NTP pyrophosphatase (non-canonical NTP hydrolase)
MTSPKHDDTVKEISQLIWQHAVDRDWDHPEPRSLAISISLEASELLEHYQWSGEPVGDKEALGEELADVLIYAFQLAHVIGVDPADIIRDKLQKAAKKYPAERFKGLSSTEKSKVWLETKIQHRENKKTL